MAKFTVVVLMSFLTAVAVSMVLALLIDASDVSIVAGIASGTVGGTLMGLRG